MSKWRLTRFAMKLFTYSENVMVWNFIFWLDCDFYLDFNRWWKGNRSEVHVGFVDQKMYFTANELHDLLFHDFRAIINSRYRKYAIWPRDGACHANHACAALTVSRSCRQAFVFFHWKCTQVLQKSLSLSIKQICFVRYNHDLLRHLVAFSKFEWFMSSDPKFKNSRTHFVHKP